MTATLTAVRCPKKWCLAADDCEHDNSHDQRVHNGRPSMVRSVYSNVDVQVAPTEVTEPDGSPFTGPLVELYIGDAWFQATANDALDLAVALADFAAEQVPVGTEVDFYGSNTQDERDGSTLTLRRLSDTPIDIGNVAPRYISFGAVELAIVNANSNPEKCKTGIDAPTAAAFARYIRAAALEACR